MKRCRAAIRTYNLFDDEQMRYVLSHGRGSMHSMEICFLVYVVVVLLTNLLKLVLNCLPLQLNSSPIKIFSFLTFLPFCVCVCVICRDKDSLI